MWPSQPDDGNLVNSSDLSWSRDIFAVGDELGYIRLFRFPCSQPGVGDKSFIEVFVTIKFN